jgi:hypothetical protein
MQLIHILLLFRSFQSYCNNLNAKLVEIETAVEDEFLRLHIADNNLAGLYTPILTWDLSTVDLSLLLYRVSVKVVYHAFLQESISKLHVDDEMKDIIGIIWRHMVLIKFCLCQKRYQNKDSEKVVIKFTHTLNTMLYYPQVISFNVSGGPC